MSYQPRYLAYCAAHSTEPDAMLAADDERWPGGRMCGFILWIASKWNEWYVAIGKKPAVLGPEEHRQFDEWLNDPFDHLYSQNCDCSTCGKARSQTTSAGEPKC